MLVVSVFWGLWMELQWKGEDLLDHLFIHTVIFNGYFKAFQIALCYLMKRLGYPFLPPDLHPDITL